MNLPVKLEILLIKRKFFLSGDYNNKLLFVYCKIFITKNFIISTEKRNFCCGEIFKKNALWFNNISRLPGFQQAGWVVIFLRGEFFIG